MSQLPTFKTDDQEVQLLQTRWKSQLDPILKLPILDGNLLTNINLVAGSTNSINHLLGRTQLGWFLTDNIFNVQIYRAQPFTAQTLILAATGSTTVSLWVF